MAKDRVQPSDDLRPCFGGLLFRAEFGDAAPANASQPDFFVDLGLDQIVDAVTKAKDEYQLRPSFWRPPGSVEAVRFRHEVFRDLEQAELVAALRAFAASMRTVRRDLARAEQHRHRYQQWRWRLDAANRYWSCVARLSQDLQASPIAARGLEEFRDYLADYATSDESRRRTSEGLQIAQALSAIRYDVLIQGLRVQVRDSARDADYGAAVEETFAAFDKAGARTYEFQFDTSLHVNRVEGDILTLVGSIYAETFKQLEGYSGSDIVLVDPTVGQFDREIQFYLSYLEHVRRIEAVGLDFCLPTVSEAAEVISGEAIFDLALASKLAHQGKAPVANDFRLLRPQRMIVVTGPNQGGKTTFARTIGQLHYLASLGLPTPGAAARLALPDRVFTHFERGERMASLRGKLQDDLLRVRAILERASPRSVVVINEIFASTTLRDAIWLSRSVARRILDLDSLCVWVTFIDEVADLGEKVLSMASTVEPGNPAARTFRILPQPPNGLAYAMSLAEKHRLDHAALRKRLS